MIQKTDAIQQIVIEVEKLKMQDQYQQAIVMLENSIIKYSDDYRLFEELTDIYIYQQNLEKAIKSIEFALELNPESATGNYLKGFLLLTQEQLTEAVFHLEKSNRLMGNNPEVLRNLGFSYSLVGEYEKWISILKRALHLSPNDELITEDLAMALIGNGEVLEWNVLLRQIEKAKQ